MLSDITRVFRHLVGVGGSGLVALMFVAVSVACTEVNPAYRGREAARPDDGTQGTEPTNRLDGSAGAVDADHDSLPGARPSDGPLGDAAFKTEAGQPDRPAAACGSGVVDVSLIQSDT